MSLTNFPNGVSSFGIPIIGGIAGIPFTGNYYFVNYANGADGNEGSPSNPMKTISGAYARCTAGNNDVIVIIGDGSTAATQRVDEAFTWAKNATHLVGITAPTGVAQRARIAPTSTTTAFANFITVSASGCYFANFSLFDGFDTGTTSQICWTDTGSRNCYENVAFGGMGDTASAQSTGSRSLKLSGSESTFRGCTFGLDTVTRTVANATVELAGACARNTFDRCTFPVQTSSATSVVVLATGAAAIDRWTIFRDCVFVNSVKSTSTAMTGVAKLTSASAGGLLLFKNCTAVGIASFGYDATSVGQIYVDGAVPTGATTGIAVAAA